jgi:hypothetical protein
MSIILKTAAKMATQFLQKTGAMKHLNPYVVEWVLHYVEGSQETKSLPKDLISITKGQIACTLVRTFWFDENTLSGIAGWYNYRGDSSYYTHPTMGVVGGFSYKLISFEDRFVVRCEDTWDFNGSSFLIPFPDFCDLRILINILKRVGIPVLMREDDEMEKIIGVNETWLAQFNEKHCFKTVWEVELPNKMSCPINSPLKESWERSERKRKRRERCYLA